MGVGAGEEAAAATVLLVEMTRTCVIVVALRRSGGGMAWRTQGQFGAPQGLTQAKAKG